MIPRDIESGEQWQVRWVGPMGEIVRTGNEAQVRYMARQHAEYLPIVEVRTITVGQWVDPDIADPEPTFEEDDEDD